MLWVCFEFWSWLWPQWKIPIHTGMELWTDYSFETTIQMEPIGPVCHTALSKCCQWKTHRCEGKAYFLWDQLTMSPQPTCVPFWHPPENIQQISQPVLRGAERLNEWPSPEGCFPKCQWKHVHSLFLGPLSPQSKCPPYIAISPLKWDGQLIVMSKRRLFSYQEREKRSPQLRQTLGDESSWD